MTTPEQDAALRLRSPLMREDMTGLARLARNFVAANERRRPGYRWPTLDERAALDSLRSNIASLDQKERP